MKTHTTEPKRERPLPTATNPTPPFQLLGGWLGVRSPLNSLTKCILRDLRQSPNQTLERTGAPPGRTPPEGHQGAPRTPPALLPAAAQLRR